MRWLPASFQQFYVAYILYRAFYISVYWGEYDVPDGDFSSIIVATSDCSASLEPQEIRATIQRWSLGVSKTTGIPMHVMLLADMQNVIQVKHIFLWKMKNIINEEFNKWQVGHVSFQVQKQVKSMISTIQDKIFQKVDAHQQKYL